MSVTDLALGIDITQLTTGTEAVSAERLMMYPNPVRKQLVIFGSYSNAQVEIYTLTGAKLYQKLDNVSLPYVLNTETYGCILI
jgi:hypothetical protein